MYFYYPIDSTIPLDSAIQWDSIVKNINMLNGEHCPINMLSIKDALEALEGKWKLLILFALYSGPKRFKQIAKEVSGITDKTLSKELKSLETNALIKREVFDTFPPTVEYTITEHGLSLNNLVEELHLWGMLHRRKVMGGGGELVI